MSKPNQISFDVIEKMENEAETSLKERKKYREELLKFTQDIDRRVQELCSIYHFDYEEISQNKKPFIICPFNPGHCVPEPSIERHLKNCEWNALGYTKDCKPLPESALSEQSPSTVKFDMELQQKVLKEAKQKNPELNIENYDYYLLHGIIISFYRDEEKLIPLTSDRLMSDFTVDERRAMYDYVVANTIGPDIGSDITNMNKTTKQSEDEKNSTILELLAQERNLKRRRAKYRGVHTNKKSYVEIMREVVEQQMEMYKEYISEKYNITITENEENGSYLSSNEFKEREQKSFDQYCDRQSSSKYKRDTDNTNNEHLSEKFDKSYRHHYDKNQRHNSYKSSNHYKDNYQNSSRNQDFRNSAKAYEKSESRDRSREDKVYGQDKYRDKTSSKSKTEDHHGHSRERNRSRSRSIDSRRDYKRDRSRSKERKHEKRMNRSRSQSVEKNPDKSSDSSRKRKSHKKHKKEHKSKRDKSKDNSDEQSHKHSKRKRNKKRSRSRSHN